ncbi:hypothetical protein BP6252_08929 [Coleophoma cylindrospora]|uniref:Linalool dehydratase/isomerase domain-containing protein n=1 Tax=Coleophoma cylindrospora TaxID=1849047 RepID=A0A3D8R0F5_9HELO|nr:hypothetical protein BP6252_08929 [Coleophoma cylindrospora]
MAGKGLTKSYYQTRTLLLYTGISLVGLFLNQTSQSPKLKAAALGLLFPGAGLTTVATIPALLVFLLSTALIPLTLFAWFSCGGVFFPLFLWSGTAALSAALAQETLFEPAAYAWPFLCIVGIGYVTLSTYRANMAAEIERKARNEWLIDQVYRNQTDASEVPAPGSRELDLQTLRFVQWFMELALTDENDWSYHNIIDQFQTSAIRYQLYETVYALGMYQAHYAPGYHGALSQAQRNVIHKSTKQEVMNYWKWESLFGKFNVHDWNPIKKDNIMVTGYILQAIGIYQNNTGDKCFEEKDCLEFCVTDKARFKADFQSINDAVYDNMSKNAYTLYPCEPNWHYTPCNLVAIGGVIASDRALKTNYGSKVSASFQKNLEEEFTTRDGSILPIRSELTGFTIPGLCGVLTNAHNSFLCSASFPHIAHRNWALARRESVRYEADGRGKIINLVGADKIDPGNYKAGHGYSYAVFAASAAEFGDRKLNRDFLAQIDTELYPVYITETGASRNKGLSTIGQATLLRARMGGYQDWHNMLNAGPPASALNGPLLVDAKFPDILVAKAYSHDGRGLELVLYNDRAAGSFTIGLDRLMPHAAYRGQAGQEFHASAQGTARISVMIDGRTRVNIEPVA